MGDVNVFKKIVAAKKCAVNANGGGWQARSCYAVVQLSFLPVGLETLVSRAL